jgi:hypothetical protein
MTADPLEDATPKPAPEFTPVQSDCDPFDPLRWEVPVVCKDCDKDFKVPYRHFQAGVVFHCPHCHGSYVPTLPMYRKVHDTFETFYARMRRERDEMTKSAGNERAYSERLKRQLAEFDDRLNRLAHELRPAGKMVRRKGLAAMFT